MCASVFPVDSQKHRRCFCRNGSSDMCYCEHVLKRMVDTVAVSDKDPLITGASFECWCEKGNAGEPCARGNGCAAA